jgi:putative transposase
LRKELNAIKAEQFPWMRDVTKNAPQLKARRTSFAFPGTHAR